MSFQAWYKASVMPPRVAGAILAVARGYHWAGHWAKVSQEGNTATLFVADEIGCLGLTAKEVLAQLESAQVVELIIDSHGGCSCTALELFKGLRGRVRKAVILSACQSAAVTIAMSAERIFAVPDVRLLIHAPRLCRFGEADELRQSADYLDKLKKQIMGVILERTRQPAAVVNKWFEGENYFSAQEAMAVGLVDELLPPRTMANPESCQAQETSASGQTESERELFAFLAAYGKIEVTDRQIFLHRLSAWGFYNSEP
jgi:ATP-dependent protease ClpP protease subunit